jgi:hypothetical protein
MKLFTIGDSISQGFMSGAAARTDLCFSTLIAKQLKIEKYQFPVWALDGMPFNIETLFRKLEKSYGSGINTLEWVLAFANTVPHYLNEVETYYETGDGAADKKYPKREDFFHNVSVRGFNVADSWLVTPAYCLTEINKTETKNGSFSSVDKSFLRTALKVLNPQLKPEHNNKSQIEWLKFHAVNEGVENIIIWLGANNALGTILDLDINFTDGKGQETKTPSDQLEFNLWHPADFIEDYKTLLHKIDDAIENGLNKNTKVFVVTVPLITIAPLIKGVGDIITVENGNLMYSKYYTYFPFEEEYAFKKGVNLGFNQVLHIENCIRKYNEDIVDLVMKQNLKSPNRYHIVDMCTVLNQLAFKRNGSFPKYKFPKYFDFKYPMPNTKYYHADVNGTLKQGGIFSLDGVHPSAIAHGIIAHEVLKVMQEAGVENTNPETLDWDKIFETDTLYQNPIKIMHEIYDNAKLAEMIMSHVKKLAKKDKNKKS